MAKTDYIVQCIHLFIVHVHVCKKQQQFMLWLLLSGSWTRSSAYNHTYRVNRVNPKHHQCNVEGALIFPHYVSMHKVLCNNYTHVHVHVQWNLR